jgi:hypothetical protein
MNRPEAIQRAISELEAAYEEMKRLSEPGIEAVATWKSHSGSERMRLRKQYEAYKMATAAWQTKKLILAALGPLNGEVEFEMLPEHEDPAFE